MDRLQSSIGLLQSWVDLQLRCARQGSMHAPVQAAVLQREWEEEQKRRDKLAAEGLATEEVRLGPLLSSPS